MAANPLMKNEVVDVPIGPWVYSIEKLGALMGRKIVTRCLRAVGPAFDAEDTIGALCRALTDEDLDFVCAEFAKKTAYRPADQPGALFYLQTEFDRHFAGHYGTMVLWLKACFEVNYGDFLGELGIDPTALQGVITKFKEMATPMAPTSPSGAASLRGSGA